MRMAFAITLGVTLVSISGIAMAELLYPKYL